MIRLRRVGRDLQTAVALEGVGHHHLAAEGEGLTWYVEGTPLGPDPVSGRAIWKPTAPGFYRLTVVDAEGRKAAARVRIRGG